MHKHSYPTNSFRQGTLPQYTSDTLRCHDNRMTQGPEEKHQQPHSGNWDRAEEHAWLSNDCP
jgi:hypothetical protein